MTVVFLKKNVADDAAAWPGTAEIEDMIKPIIELCCGDIYICSWVSTLFQSAYSLWSKIFFLKLRSIVKCRKSQSTKLSLKYTHTYMEKLQGRNWLHALVWAIPWWLGSLKETFVTTFWTYIFGQTEFSGFDCTSGSRLNVMFVFVRVIQMRSPGSALNSDS